MTWTAENFWKPYRKRTQALIYISIYLRLCSYACSIHAYFMRCMLAARKLALISSTFVCPLTRLRVVTTGAHWRFILWRQFTVIALSCMIYIFRYKTIFCGKRGNYGRAVSVWHHQTLELVRSIRSLAIKNLLNLSVCIVQTKYRLLSVKTFKS